MDFQWISGGFPVDFQWISSGFPQKIPDILRDFAGDLRARGATASQLCSRCPGPVGIPRIRAGVDGTGILNEWRFSLEKNDGSLLENH